MHGTPGSPPASAGADSVAPANTIAVAMESFIACFRWTQSRDPDAGRQRDCWESELKSSCMPQQKAAEDLLAVLSDAFSFEHASSKPARQRRRSFQRRSASSIGPQGPEIQNA